MDTVIEKISEIESAATGIMEDANERKKAFAKEMEERTAAFDAQLEAETNKDRDERTSRETAERFPERPSRNGTTLPGTSHRICGGTI